MPTKPKLSESDIQKFGTDLLALDGWRPLRTDPVRNREWGKGFGELGMPDYLYIRYGGKSLNLKWRMETGGGELPDNNIALVIADVLWCEWKRKGCKAKAHQKAWHAAERARGGLVWVAGEDFMADPKSFKAWYLQSGLNRSIRP